MKPYILLLAFLIGAMVCKAQHGLAVKNDWMDMNLNGRVKQVTDSGLNFNIEKDDVTNKIEFDSAGKSIDQINFNPQGNFTLQILNYSGDIDSIEFTYDNNNNVISEGNKGEDLTIYKRDGKGHLTETDEGHPFFDTLLHKQSIDFRNKRLCKCDANGNVTMAYDGDNITLIKYDKDNYITELKDSILNQGIDVMKGTFVTTYKYDTKHNLIEKDYPKGRTGLLDWKIGVRREEYKYNNHNDVISKKYFDKNGLVSTETTKYVYDKSNNWIKSNLQIYLYGSKHEISIHKRKIVYY